jgi:hypothetical protein
MLKGSITAVAVLFSLCLLAAPAQAVQTALSSPQEGATVYPGDEVEVTLSVINETEKKDIVHVFFDLIVDIDGEPVVVGSAKRRLKLAPGEAVSETILGVVPEVPLTAEADVTVEATAVGRKSKTEDSDAVFFVVSP